MFVVPIDFKDPKIETVAKIAGIENNILKNNLASNGYAAKIGLAFFIWRRGKWTQCLHKWTMAEDYI